MESNNTNKQSIIGFILIGLLFFGYMLYNNYQMEKYNEQLALEQAAEAIATQASAQIAAQSAATIAQNQPQQAAPEVDPFIINAEKEEQVTIENDYLRLTLSSVGGQIVDATLKQHTKYAPKEERNELVKLFDPQSAAFDLSFYVKDGYKNVKVETLSHNFTLLPVVKQQDKQVVTFRLPFKGEASIDFVYSLYDQKLEERDYLVDFDVKLNGLAPMMANQTSIGIEWSNYS